MNRKARTAGIVLLSAIVLGTVGIAVLLRQRADARRYQNPENHYGVRVFSREQQTKAERQHDEYLRRAKALRTAFEPFARQNHSRITRVLTGKSEKNLLPRDPRRILPQWDAISDPVAAEDLPARLSEAIVFSWNASVPGGVSAFLPARRNVLVAESLVGKECIAFWLDGRITEESRFGATKTTTAAHPLQELAPPYPFFRKATDSL